VEGYDEHENFPLGFGNSDRYLLCDPGLQYHGLRNAEFMAEMFHRVRLQSIPEIRIAPEYLPKLSDSEKVVVPARAGTRLLLISKFQ
jgi:hypothetical protein